MAAIIQVKPITDVSDERRASAAPRDPEFFQSPYAFYAERHASNPAFFWEEYCSATNALDVKFCMWRRARKSACPSPSRTWPILT
jgi:hypothetical protein